MRALFATFATILLGMAIPMNASAAICVGYSDYNSKKCKIPLCALRPGGFSTSKCHGPLALMAWRAFWGKPPIPLPPSECGCNWIPPLVIPTDKYGVPLSAGSYNFTPFNKVSTEATTKYAQATANDSNSVMVFEQGNNANNNKANTNKTSKSLTTMSAAEKRALAANIMAKQDDFYTTCNQNTFRRSGRSSSCYTVTKNSRTDMVMRHSKYRRGLKRRHKYDYKITSRSLDGSHPTTETRMQIKHKTMTYCQRFVGGSPVTDTKCGVANLSQVVTTEPSILDPNAPSVPIDTVPGLPVDVPTGLPTDVPSVSPGYEIQ